MSLDGLEDLKNEVAMISEVDHPHIVKYYETYDDTKYIYLVMEICTGGELFSRIMSGK
jgi:calcium-dependent protein kinase